MTADVLPLLPQVPLLAPEVEEKRLAALQETGLLDSAPEAAFDRITRLASRLFEVPICLVSLVDRDRQWFKSCFGLGVSQTPRDQSFCAHAVASSSLLIVPDATKDARFADNPLVMGEPKVRFYAGAPLRTRAGFDLGTLCLIDTRPRPEGLSQSQSEVLLDLAAMASDEIELRLASRRLEQSLRSLAHSENRFRALVENTSDLITVLDSDGLIFYQSPSVAAVLGFSPGELIGCPALKWVHPADVTSVQEILTRVTTQSAREEDEGAVFRARHRDGSWRWLEVSARNRLDDPAVNGIILNSRDISARKEAEDALRQSEASKSAMFESALDAILTIDRQSIVQDWNPAAQGVFGWTREEAIGRPIDELIMPEALRGAHRHGMARFLETGVGRIIHRRVELPALRKDGQMIDVELVVTPVHVGEETTFTGFVRDITLAKQTQNALDASLQRVTTILESIADAFFSLDLEWRFTYVNAQAEVFLKRGASELLGTDLWEEFPRILDTPFETHYRHAMQSGQATAFEEFFAPSGVFFKVHVYPSDEGLSVYVEDISDRKRAEAALLKSEALVRESEARYARTLANVPGMVYRFALQPDGTTAFPFVSQACRDIYGLEPEDVMRDAGLILNSIWPEERAGFEQSIAQSAGHMTPWNWEGRATRPDGRVRWVRCQARPRLLDDGRILWDGLVTDFTDRKNDEVALQLAKDQAQLAQSEAERANRAKSEFLSRMSHELRTPLNAILGFGQLLELDALSPRAEQQVGQILKGGRHLLDLINEVLDIARVESGALSLAPEAVNLREVACEALDLVRPLASERGITLEDIECDASLVVLADRRRVKQILLNLLSNAVKYNRQNGQVWLGCRVEGPAFLELEVRDTGEGLSLSELERLFVPFERLGAEARGVEGTGIGLAISRRLAEAMNGTLTARSEVGGGSTFSLRLPVAAQQPEARPLVLSPAPVAESAPVSTRWVVLYVEDNLPNLQLVQALLANRPEIRLLSAKTALAGLELARVHCPDVVLLDLHLPDGHGEDVLQQLKAGADTRNIPVVVVSADATPGQIERLLAKGAATYLTKPFDLKHFRNTLDALLRSSSGGKAEGAGA
jgi:PAS domain S-box-containing protein